MAGCCESAWMPREERMGGKVYRREGGRGFMVAASLAPTLSFLVSQHSASPVALASFQA